MKIDPRQITPAPLPRSGESASVTPQDAESKSSSPAPQPEYGRGDRVEISDAARAVIETASSGAVPVGPLPPERLREILDNMLSGVYESPKSLDTVATALAPQLKSS